MPSPPVPSSLIPCVSTTSLLVISHPEIHQRKRSAVLKRILEKDSAVIVVQTENPKFGPLIEKVVEIINLWDDCWGWDSGGGGTDPGRVAHVQCRISSAATKTTAPATLLFHSLASLLLHEENTPVAVARMVNNCMGCAGVGRVVAVMEDEEKLKSLRNLFQTELLLRPADGGLIRAVCRHRPTAGKPSAKSESFEVTKDGEVRAVAAKVKVAAAAEMGKDAAENDAMMSKLTTFSLQLSEEEKRARSEVVMPFWKEEQKAAAAVAAGGGEVEEEEDAVRITSKRAAAESQGKIYYEPDDGDDWDEEDPDDDLDF